jgi:FkbM family methyltransferase
MERADPLGAARAIEGLIGIRGLALIQEEAIGRGHSKQGAGVITRVLRSLFPLPLRVRLRRVPAVRWALRRAVGGMRAKPFPGTTWLFHYDGYRNSVFDGAELEAPERQYREYVLDVLRRRGRPKVIWDIGANIGFWSLHLSRAFPDATELRCFEPDPLNLEVLSRNRDENRLDHWVIRPVGLSSHAGSASFYSDPETGATGSVERGQDFIGRHYKLKRVERQIEVTTIDAEVQAGAPPPDFMKIDIEGHELAALQGGVETLRRYRPVLCVEVSRDADKLGQFLAELGYEFYNPTGQRIAQPVFETLALPAGP